MSEYLRFERVQRPGRKTPNVNIYSRRDGSILGTLLWFGRWRQFVFAPRPGTLWNPDCLTAVNNERSSC